MRSSDLMCAPTLKNTPSRLARQTDSGGMIRKPCGWEAVIWHSPANVRPQLRLTQAQCPKASANQRWCLVFCDTPTDASAKTPHRSTLPPSTKQKQANITPRMSTDVSRHMHQKVKLRSGTYLPVFVQLVYVCWFVQITYMYLGFPSPISAISSSVFPAIFQSSLPALLPRFLLTKYNDMDA
jgi:hypothetical protein